MTIPEEWSHYYELSSDTLADWVESQGAEQWWIVDSDRYLNSRNISPSPMAALVRVLRPATRGLLVRTDEPEGNGQMIGADKLEILAEPLTFRAFPLAPNYPKPKWADDRCLWLCWKGEHEEWMLAEDSRSTAAFRNVMSHRAGNV